MSGQTPSAGWYADPNEPGGLRWWNGAAWTEHRTPAAPPSTAVAVPSPAPAPSRNVESPRCPICGSRDASQRMSVAIDSGFSTSAGTAGSITSRGDLAYTRFASASATALSARIAPPPRPAFPFVRVFFWLWFAFTIVCALWVAGSSGAGAIGFFFGLWGAFGTWIPALVVTVLGKLFTASSYAQQQAVWDRRATELRAAYYCSRDDVVFAGEYAAAPEAFRAMVFTR